MVEKVEGKILWFYNGTRTDGCITDGRLSDELELAFDYVPEADQSRKGSVVLRQGQDGFWKGILKPGDHHISCNVYREGSRLGLIGTGHTDWIEGSGAYQWVAELKLSPNSP